MSDIRVCIQVQRQLLHAMSDPHAVIRAEILACFDRQQRTPRELHLRLLTCARDLYDPAVQRGWCAHGG